MAFVGRIVYLVLFPGALFIVLAGALAWSLLGRGVGLGLGTTVDHGPGLPGLFGPLARARDRAGEASSLELALAAVKTMSLAWVSCLAFGVISGDLALLYALLVAALACDIPAGVRPGAGDGGGIRDGRETATRMLGWSVPLALAFAGIALRTGRVGVQAIIGWQASNGMLAFSTCGGGLAVAGSAALLAAAVLCATGIAGSRPLGVGMQEVRAPEGEAGVQVSMKSAARAGQFFVAALVLSAMFLGGPTDGALHLLAWALKVAGVMLLLALVEAVSGRAARRPRAAWPALAAAALAAAGMALVWAGAP